MGLDMNLYGRKLIAYNRWDEKSEPLMEDGFPVSDVILEMGYWRKHPNLHGYIVNTFADGEDECQKIELFEEDLLKIAAAIRAKELPHTDGFFFGDSQWHDGKEEEYAVIFERAAEWQKAKLDRDKEFYRQVYYKASW